MGSPCWRSRVAVNGTVSASINDDELRSGAVERTAKWDPK
jgi:hypothetical protein